MPTSVLPKICEPSLQDQRLAFHQVVRRVLLALAAATLLLHALAAQAAAPARVAVATNFAAPLAALTPGFERATGHRVLVSAGSTGKLYAQIRQGAPFDLFLAADRGRPDRLAAEGATLAAPFAYARGRLVLWSAGEGQSASALRAQLEDTDERLAIANEMLAPYGLAAKQALTSMGLWASSQPRLLRGENVGQAYALAATGNAPLALVAASLTRSRARGSGWLLPVDLYEPVIQAAVVLRGGAGSEAAGALAAYLQSQAVQSELESWGYLPLDAARQ